MAPPTTLSATGSKSRPQARKRLLDDAAFTVSGIKRSAPEKLDVAEPRVKRKRVETQSMSNTSNGIVATAAAAAAGRKGYERRFDESAAVIDFTNLPLDAIHRYLAKYELIPPIYPSPLSTSRVPAPHSLLNPAPLPRAPTPPALLSTSGVTAANRPRRDSAEFAVRRSSRLIEEEERERRAPVLNDSHEIHGVLAEIAQRHWDRFQVREQETLGGFLYAVRTKGQINLSKSRMPEVVVDATYY